MNNELIIYMASLFWLLFLVVLGLLKINDYLQPKQSSFRNKTRQFRWSALMFIIVLIITGASVIDIIGGVRF